MYITGGAAWLNFETAANCGAEGNNPNIGPTCTPLNPPPFSITHTTTKLGWTIGGGIESMLWSNWLVRAEYRFADFGATRFTDSVFAPAPLLGLPGTTTATYNVDLQTHTVLFGLAYKFGRYDAPIRAAY
jgi:outer membrane immunogenic protein